MHRYYGAEHASIAVSVQKHAYSSVQKHASLLGCKTCIDSSVLKHA